MQSMRANDLVSEVGVRPGRIPALLSALTVLTAVAIGMQTRITLASKHSIYPYDAYYYLGGARSLAENLSYSFRNIPQTRYQPGYPIVVAPFTWLLSPERAGILVAAVAWAGVGITSYFIGRRIGGRTTGVVAAILVTFNPIAIKWASVPMSEALFTLFFSSAVLALIIGVQKRSPWLFVIASGLAGYASITRFEGIAFLPLLGAGIYWFVRDTGMKRVLRLTAMFVGGIILFALPSLLWYLRNRGIGSNELSYSDEFTRNFNLTYESVKTRLNYYFWSGQKVRPLSLVAYTGMLVGVVRLKREVMLLALWFATIVGGHLLWYYTYERFLMGALPALAVSTAWISVAVIKKLNKLRRLQIALTMVWCVLLLMLAVFSTWVGINFTHLHILGLNTDWGGESFVAASRMQRDLPGGAVSNRGAVLAYWGEQDTPYIFPVVADRDEVPFVDPVKRARYLKDHGVERVILATRGRDPYDVLKDVKLDGIGMVLESTITIEGPFGGADQVTVVFRFPDSL